jgi:hypothetical protein
MGRRNARRTQLVTPTKPLTERMQFSGILLGHRQQFQELEGKGRAKPQETVFPSPRIRDVDGFQDGAPHQPRYGTMTLVAEKKVGDWLVITGQNT